MSEDRPEPLSAHLQELRKRLIRVIIAFIIGFVAGWLPVPYSNNGNVLSAIFLMEYRPVAAYLYYMLVVRPLPKDVKVITLGLLTPLEVAFYICMLLGTIVAVPVLAFELYQFVKRGLYPHERRAFKIYFTAVGLLFFAGGVFGYIVIYHALIRLYVILAPMFGLKPYILARNIMNEFLGTIIFSGILFETPIIMLLLSKMGIVNPKSYVEYRPVVYAIAMILIAIFNPDPTLLSSIIWVVTFIILYEVGIVLAKRSRRT
ncbi:MAG: preprotein translocase subunit TatC [Crenarchaeota archaeon]|nr:preprotein translocase subunit TatC [Thermoproteota archaeon]